MSIFNVRAALVQKFRDAALFPADDVNYENISFSPPADRPWASFFFVPSQPDLFTLGTAGLDELNGFVQIDLNYPRDSGENTILQKFEQIRSTFTPSVGLTYSGTEVLIRSCGRSQGRVIEGFYRISATIQFVSYINR